MMKKIFLSLTCLFGIQVCAQPMRVLFIGNSYTHFNKMPEMIQSLANERGLKVDINMDAISNQSLKMQTQRPELFEKINSQKWDYVIIQGFSRELAYDQAYIDTNVVPYAKLIIDSVYQKNACTNIMLYQTWAYEDGFHGDSMNWSFQDMGDQIHKGYLYLSSIFDLPIVPVGKVWETIKENHSNIELYEDDKQHPSPYGSYVAACSFYVALFKSEPDVPYYAGLDKTKAELIQSAAFTLINANLNRYKLSEKSLEINKYKVEGSGGVKCYANYPSAETISWDFGDGNTLTGARVKHAYKKKGNYTIIITIHDTCGKRVIRRRVQI